MPFLRHFANGAPVGAIELSDEITIGRAPGNSVQIDDGTVSAQHALVRRAGDKFVIVDCDSTNGVAFQGKKVKQHEFAEGDVVTLGTHDFEFLNRLPQEFEKTLKIRKSWIPGLYYTE